MGDKLKRKVIKQKNLEVNVKMKKELYVNLCSENVDRLGILSVYLKALNGCICDKLQYTCDLNGNMLERGAALCLIDSSDNLRALSELMFELVTELNAISENLDGCVNNLLFDDKNEELEKDCKLSGERV